MIEKMTDIDYFNDKEYITNSMLSWLIVSKRFFLKKFNEGPESDIPDYFNLGSAAHCYILEQDEFDERFIVMRQQAPSNKQQRLFCESIAEYENHIDYHKEKQQTSDIVQRYSEVYSTVNKSEKAIESAAILLYSKYKDYISFLKRGVNKIILTVDEMDTIQSIYNEARQHGLASMLLFDDYISDGSVSYNEHVIHYIFDGIKMKSKLDRIIIDYDNKTAVLIDFKTYSHRSIKESPYTVMKRSMEDYGYHRQLALYECALKEFLEFEGLSKFSIVTYLVAAQTNLMNEVQVYQISEETLARGLIEAEILINEYKDIGNINETIFNVQTM